MFPTKLRGVAAAIEIACAGTSGIPRETSSSSIDAAKRNAPVETAKKRAAWNPAWPRLAEQIETGDFVADISRIEREMGWRPVTTLRDGIEQTVAFHRTRLPS